MDRDKEKCVFVIDESLPVGMIANTAAILGLTIGEEVPSIIGPVIPDGAGRSHLGITIAPIPVLRGTRAILMDLREKLFDPEYADVKVVDFSEPAMYSRSYAEYAEKLAEISGDAVRYLGLAMIGPKKKVNRLTGGIPLLK
ncbi:MAG: DUF2000 domain-containing protein [Mogibacterium sp.]|nr:DUF2000 domain-containing protein [Mogibacterium sp.]